MGLHGLGPQCDAANKQASSLRVRILPQQLGGGGRGLFLCDPIMMWVPTMKLLAP